MALRADGRVSDLLSSAGGRTFAWMWLTQFVSTFGTNLTGFALGIWLYQNTGQATPLFLTALSYTLPGLLLSPVAGSLVDRYSRKHLMMLSDSVQGVVTLVIMLLIGLEQTGVMRFQLWWLYALLAISSAAGTFQWPAQSSTISLLVPRQHLGRANGMLGVSDGINNLVAPIVSGALVSMIGITNVMLIDVATFVFAIVVMRFLPSPRPAQSAIGRSARGSILSESVWGWRYILERPGLLGLLMTFTGVNFTNSLCSNLVTPLVLSRADNQTTLLGLVYSAFGLGILAGSTFMTITGGPRPRVHGVFLGIGLSGLMAQTVFGLAQSVPVWMLANFVAGCCLPVMNGSSQAIWQSKVEADVQGRVFTARRLIAQITTPLAFAIAGPLADRVFTPFATGNFGPMLEPIFGPETGRGYALMFVVFGLLTCLNGFSAYLRPRARNVERDLPDVALRSAQ
jgi:MFS family permease